MSDRVDDRILGIGPRKPLGDEPLDVRLLNIYAFRALQIGKLCDRGRCRELNDDLRELRKDPNVNSLMKLHITKLVQSLRGKTACSTWTRHCFISGDVKPDNENWNTQIWALNGSERVSASVCFEVRCRNGTIQYRNLKSKWTWYDEIDARNPDEFRRAQENSGDEGASWQNLLVESYLVNFVGDELLGANYDVGISWEYNDSATYSTTIPCKPIASPGD